MEIDKLYIQLKEAYTEENLHQISSAIIDLFKEGRYDSLRKIQSVVNEFTQCTDQKINKVFAKLIMIYHPDRLKQAQEQVETAYKNNDFESLYSLAHILRIQEIELEAATAGTYLTDEDLAEEFGWDYQADGFHYFMAEEEFESFEDAQDTDFSAVTFLSAIKRKVYGNLNVDFPMYLLEDLEEIEMAEYEIESLEGIEACRFARVIDLSNNNLTDISDLKSLDMVERLYLSNNHISLIDSLYYLDRLQVLDISFNDVDDLSPLFELEELEYLNVMGNRVPAWQLEQLQLKGIMLIA